jgi:hypothetical protein
MNIHVEGNGNGPRIHNGKGTNNIMRSDNVRENVYLKQVVIKMMRIWIIEGIHQSSASCVRVIYIEVMGISPNIH